MKYVLVRVVCIGGALEFSTESGRRPSRGVRATTYMCSEGGVGTLEQVNGATSLDRIGRGEGKCVLVSMSAVGFVSLVVLG